MHKNFFNQANLRILAYFLIFILINRVLLLPAERTCTEDGGFATI